MNQNQMGAIRQTTVSIPGDRIAISKSVDDTRRPYIWPAAESLNTYENERLDPYETIRWHFQWRTPRILQQYEGNSNLLSGTHPETIVEVEFERLGRSLLVNWFHLNPILRLLPPKLGFQVRIVCALYARHFAWLTLLVRREKLV